MKNLKNIIKTSKSYNEVSLKHYGYSNGRTQKIIKKFIEIENVDISHWRKDDVFCLNCNNIIDSNKKFCNSSCAATFNNKKRVHSDETKKKITDKLKGRPTHNSKKSHKRSCVICGSEFERIRKENNQLSKSKVCSDICRSELKSLAIKKQMEKRIKEGKHKGWIKRNIVSYPELFFINVLNNNNIEFEHNYPIKQRDLGLDNSYNYFLDFYFEDLKLCLEVDGKQHERRKEHDKIRDTLLNENGVKVYRIKWKNIKTKSGKEYIKEEIDKFLEYYRVLSE